MTPGIFSGVIFFWKIFAETRESYYNKLVVSEQYIVSAELTAFSVYASNKCKLANREWENSIKYRVKKEEDGK